jgi:hypothetical protein
VLWKRGVRIIFENMKWKFVFTCVILPFCLKAQLTELTSDARLYYDLYNQATDILIIEKDTAKAIEVLEKSKAHYLENIKFGFCSSIGRLIGLYMAFENYEKTYDNMVLEIKQNSRGNDPKWMVPNKWMKVDRYKGFRTSDYWSLYQQNHDSLIRDATKNLNWQLIAEYKGLNLADQLGRSSKDLKELTKLSEDSSYNFWRMQRAMFVDIDNKIMDKYLQLLKENGFNEYKDVGGWISLDAMILMHQFSSCRKDTSEQWIYPYLDSLMLDRVYSGYYPPSSYAFNKDRSYTYLCQKDSLPQIYGHWSPLPSRKIKGGLKDVKNIDKLRSDIGLGSFYVHCIGLGIKVPEGYEIPQRYLKE